MNRTNILSPNSEAAGARSNQAAIVLVHGALTDGSVWNGVTNRLQAKGHAVHVPALPMRDLNSDAEYLEAYIERIDGPVVLVGHSYAGAVISHPTLAASGRVRALVFVAAFQPAEGEAAGELNERFPGSLLTPENLQVADNPLGGHDLTLRSDRFAEVYAADLVPEVAAVMAVSQRPIEPAVLGQPLPRPATWRTVPSWAVISTDDRSLPPQILRFMAERAGSQTVEVASSHAVPVSQPQAVADLITTAMAATKSTLNQE